MPIKLTYFDILFYFHTISNFVYISIYFEKAYGYESNYIVVLRKKTFVYAISYICIGVFPLDN